MTATRKRLTAAVCILLLCVLGAVGSQMFHSDVGFPVTAAIVGGAEGTAPASNMTEVPAVIWEKVLSQPDTMEYAALFHAFGDTDMDMDISRDVTEGEVPLLLQWDKRWGYEYYGTNYMGINGCAPTTLAIIYAGLTGNTDVTPYDIAQFSVEKGLYVSGQGTKWTLMDVGGRHLGLKVQRISDTAGAIRMHLGEGKLLAVRVGRGDFTSGGHFLVVCGIDENDMLTIRDPNSREKTEQLWELDRILEQSSCWWSFWV